MKNSVAREELIKQYLEVLHQGKIPWQESWSHCGRGYNVVTGRAYRGFNALAIQFKNLIHGYDDPRWCTFNQAKENGWKVRKGEKGTKLEFWSAYDLRLRKVIDLAVRDQLIENGRDKDEFKVFNRDFVVFNAKQLDGIEPLQELNNDIKADPVINTMLKNMKVIYQEIGNEAYYVPSQDLIRLPPKAHFKSDYAYNAIKLHEMCHATGHPSRLNRTLSSRDNMAEYAKEELRAEIGASFLMTDLRIPYAEINLDNHKAYIQNFINILENDPRELFKAITDADKISNYLLEKGGIQKDIMQVVDAKQKTSIQKSKREKSVSPKKKQINLELDR